MTIEKGAIHLGPARLDLPIRGPGRLRVLYLDDRLRLFLSPTDSPDGWEAAGLLVVQMRL